MLISVVIPVYNGEKYLRKCLESVQAYPSDEIECIIINDGSADGTEKICAQFAEQDSRFKVINKENSGVSDTRNRGISEASGEYIFFLDADDYIIAEAWREILAHAAESKYDMVAYGYYNLFDNGRTSVEQFPEGYDLKLTILSTTLLNACWGKLFRRGIIIKNNIRFRKELKTCEDAIFNIDFTENAGEYLLCNTNVLYYRIHAASVMQSTGLENKLTDFAALFERRKAYLAANDDEASERAMYRHSFSVVTDLFRSYAKNRKISEISRAYKKSMENITVAAIIAETNKEYLSPFYKKLEYMMIKCGCYTCLAVYFKIKGRFR